MRPAPVPAVQRGDGPDGEPGLLRRRSPDLVRNVHAAEIFEHEHEAVTPVLEVPVQESWRPDRSVRSETTVEHVLTPVEGLALAEFPVPGLGAGQFDDDRRRAAGLAGSIVQPTAQQLPEQPDALLDCLDIDGLDGHAAVG